MRVMLENTRTGPRIASLGGCGCFEIVMQIFFLDAITFTKVNRLVVTTIDKWIIDKNAQLVVQ